MREFLQKNADKSLQVLSPLISEGYRQSETSENVDKFLQENSYRKLVLDTYNSVNVLLHIEHGVLDQLLACFRDALFDPNADASERMSRLLQQELLSANASPFLRQLAQGQYSNDTLRMAQDLDGMMQITVEFMDKSLKGLLSGDFSILALK